MIRSATREANHIYQFITNNQVSFHLWLKENSVKDQKFSKYCDHGCRTIWPIYVTHFDSCLMCFSILRTLDFSTVNRLFTSWKKRLVSSRKSTQNYQLWTKQPPCQPFVCIIRMIVGMIHLVFVFSGSRFGGIFSSDVT